MTRSLLQELGPKNVGTLLARLLAIADDAVIVVDAQHKVVLFNEGAEHIFGYRAAQVLGQPLSMLLPDSARAVHAGHMREFARAAMPARRMAQRSDIHGRRADASLFDAEASISHVQLDGQTYFAAILRDVTEARQAARTKGLFLANMSHEIRTPLNAVIGMTTLLLDTPMSQDQREFASTIRASGEALLEIINDILDYSKTEAGKVEIEQAAFDLRRCIEDSLDLVAQRALEKHLNLAYLIEDGTPEALVGDSARIRQILVNLLSNAVKFTHQGEVFVSVDSEPLQGQLHRIRFAVHDSGIGIPADQLPLLFQSFTQVDASTTRKYGGTGLGLAISKRLAELMGGGISVQSEAGRGSVFQVNVLVEAAAAAPVVFLQRNVPLLSGKRLLVVDDNLTNRRILTRLALRWGMVPSTLPSALEALDRIRHGEGFDLAILDFSMPGMNGLELAAQIRARRSAEELPIVMLTSLGQRPAPHNEASAGLAAYLSKPIKASELFTTLSAVVQGRRVAPVAAPALAAPLDSALGTRLPLRVLIAEDHPINQRVAVQLLQRLGYRADVAGNGLAAIEAIERQAYDVVLMDIQMPEMDGLQAARWIVQRRGRNGLPRIVAMTANAMPGDREAYLAAGMDGYVAKPIELDTLTAALTQASSWTGAARVKHDSADGPIDTQRLEHLRDLQESPAPSLVQELIDMFIADAPVHLNALAQAAQSADAPQLVSLAHRLLSATDNIGARRMSSLCADIERQARAGEVDEATRLVDALLHEYERVQPALLALQPRC